MLQVQVSLTHCTLAVLPPFSEDWHYRAGLSKPDSKKHVTTIHCNPFASIPV